MIENRSKTLKSFTTQCTSSEDCDSPYKNCLGKIKRISLNNDGEDDFRTPVKIIPKIFKQAPPKKGNSKTKKSSKKTTPNLILKRTKDNFKNLDVNPEHLQMALALSKSTFTEEYPEKDRENTEPDLPSFLSSNQIPKVTTYLEKYGFKSSSHLRADIDVDYLEVAKKRKHSKFRYVTPVLYMRSSEDRESLINSKVSLILSQKKTKSDATIQFLEHINSIHLKKYVHEAICWNINSLSGFDNYFCPSLQISPTKSAVGCLLKDWDCIPGREHSQNISKQNETSKSYEDSEELNQKKTKTLNDTVICDTSREVLLDLDTTCHKTKESHEELNQIETITVNDTVICDTSFEVNEEVLLDVDTSCHIVTTTRQRLEYCASPDLFDSDDDSNHLTPLPLNDELHKDMSKCDSPVLYDKRIPTSPHFETIKDDSNSSTGEMRLHKEMSHFDSDKLCDYELNTVENLNGNGIEHFESFYDADTLVKHVAETVDITLSSDEDTETGRNEDSRDADKFKDIKDEKESKYEKFKNTNRQSFGTKYSSVDSGNDSCEYNSALSLNVTDYVNEMLNSQENEEHNSCLKDDQNMNPEVLSQSQSTCSQESIVVLSDEELNYSSKFSAHHQSDFYHLTSFDECADKNTERDEIDAVHLQLKHKYSREEVNKDKIAEKTVVDAVATTVVECPNVVTPEKSDFVNKNPISTSSNVTTPNGNLIIKTSNVTPMADYDAMDTPKVRTELDKFGIKPLKRKKGVQLLKYIYDTTHPLVNADFENANEDETEGRPSKKKKLSNDFQQSVKEDIKIVGAALTENEKEDDLIFERKCSKKVISCRIPLQIAWYNFLCCNSSLAENIILYEPIQLEVISAMLKEQSGCNFHIEDLLTFLDKKCVTVRTSQGQRSKKRAKERR